MIHSPNDALRAWQLSLLENPPHAPEPRPPYPLDEPRPIWIWSACDDGVSLRVDDPASVGLAALTVRDEAGE